MNAALNLRVPLAMELVFKFGLAMRKVTSILLSSIKTNAGMAASFYVTGPASSDAIIGTGFTGK